MQPVRKKHPISSFPVTCELPAQILASVISRKILRGHTVYQPMKEQQDAEMHNISVLPLVEEILLLPLPLFYGHYTGQPALTSTSS